MSNCFSCNCYLTCQNSGYDIQFVKRVAIALSTSNRETVESVHGYEAKKLGYNLTEIFEHIKVNAKECIYFNF